MKYNSNYDSNTVTISNDVSNTYVAGSGLKEDHQRRSMFRQIIQPEVNSDIVRIKDGGVTNAKLQNSSFVMLSFQMVAVSVTARYWHIQVGVELDLGWNNKKAITPNAVYDISGLTNKYRCQDNYEMEYRF